MNRRQKWQYFKDYYLFRTTVVTMLLAAAFFLLWNFWLKPAEKISLYVAVMDEMLDENQKQYLRHSLEAHLSGQGKTGRVVIDDDFYLEKGGLDKLEVYLHNHQVDLVIADRKTFTEFAGYGFYSDLATVSGEGWTDPEARYQIRAAGYREDDNLSFEDTETGRGPERAYGMDISGSRYGMKADRN